MKKMNLIVLALQSLMLICLSFFTIVKTDEPINYSRNYIEESYEESHSIKQDYFTFEGKKKLLEMSCLLLFQQENLESYPRDITAFPP